MKLKIPALSYGPFLGYIQGHQQPELAFLLNYKLETFTYREEKLNTDNIYEANFVFRSKKEQRNISTKRLMQFGFILVDTNMPKRKGH